MAEHQVNKALIWLGFERVLTIRSQFGRRWGEIKADLPTQRKIAKTPDDEAALTADIIALATHMAAMVIVHPRHGQFCGRLRI